VSQSSQQGDAAMAKRRITVEVELADGSELECFDEADDAAFEVAQQAYRQTLQQLAEERERAVRAVCPQCGSSDVVRKGRGPRKLYGRMGEVELSRQRSRCRSCGRSFFPSAGELGSS